MASYYEEVRKLEEKFDGLELRHILRCQNEAADQLAKLASSREPVPSGIFVNDQREPSVKPPKRKGDGTEENDPPKRAKGDNDPTAPDPGVGSGAGSRGGPETTPDPDREADPGDDPQTQGGVDHPGQSDCQQVMELEPSTGRAPDLPADWRTPLLDCLAQGKLPDDQTEA
ncbi:unnamed protein product [Urochloa humidicola]